MLWKQRSRTNWLNDGDKNTTFFKIRASKRRDKKLIECLEKEDGNVIKDPESIMKEFLLHYSSLVSASADYSSLDWDEAMSQVQPKVSDSMNAMLSQPFTAEEISRALFQMNPDKSPGIDGFSPVFYQKFWTHIKEDVCHDILKFLNSDILEESMNETEIILTPKKQKIRKLEDLRPISLCNVSLKIVTKVMAK